MFLRALCAGLLLTATLLSSGCCCRRHCCCTPCCAPCCTPCCSCCGYEPTEPAMGSPAGLLAPKKAE